MLLRSEATPKSQWCIATEVGFSLKLSAGLTCAHGGHLKRPHGGTAALSHPGTEPVTSLHEQHSMGRKGGKPALALNDSTQHTCRFSRCYLGHSQSHVPQKKRCRISVNRPEERIPKAVAWGFPPIMPLPRAKTVTHTLVTVRAPTLRC